MKGVGRWCCAECMQLRLLLRRLPNRSRGGLVARQVRLRVGVELRGEVEEGQLIKSWREGGVQSGFELLLQVTYCLTSARSWDPEVEEMQYGDGKLQREREGTEVKKSTRRLCALLPRMERVQVALPRILVILF